MAGNNFNSAGNQSNGDFDGLILIVAFFAVIGLSGWAIWSMNRDLILQALFSSVSWIATVGQYIPYLWPEAMHENFAAWSVSLAHADVSQYDWAAGSLMTSVITHTLSLIVVPLIFLRILKIRKTYVINRFVRSFNLQKLVALNASRYAAVASISKENILKTPLHVGPLAMARTPVDFALENLLLVVLKRGVGSKLASILGLQEAEETKIKVIRGWSEKKMDWSVPERRRALPHPSQCRLDEKSCDERLRDQLGDPWQGPEQLDKFKRCLLAILIVALTESLPKARELALRLAFSYSRTDKRGQHNPSIDDKGIKEILEKGMKHNRVKEVLKLHGFVSTVLMGLLCATWKKGVFTTPEFLWYKGVNRSLYLTLCQLGGDRPFPEGLGPWAHYEVEKAVGHAVLVPCVEAGTEALKQMLFDEEWIGSEDGLASEIAERKSKAGVMTTDEASPTEQV